MPKPNAIHYEKAYVVRVNRVKRAWSIALVAACIVAVPVVTYFGTLWYSGYSSSELKKIVEQQASQIDGLQADVISLKQLNANADLSLEVDRNSLEQMRQEMVDSQTQIEILQEQVKFYQSLMDPNPEKGGVYIETVSVEPASFEGEYSYNIVIAQRSSNHKRIKGKMEVEFISELNSEEVQTFALSELTENGNPLPLGFKFFQQVDGDVSLPDDFNLTKVRVVVQLDGDAAPRLDETYVWKS